MATYKVVVSGEVHATYGYVTINDIDCLIGRTYVYSEKPTISVFVSGANATAKTKCTVTVNGVQVQSGYGEYTLNTDDPIVNVQFTEGKSGNYVYYNAIITTEPYNPEIGRHNTLIDGVSHPIRKGKCLVNGTGYSIAKGRTLVGGTGYDINFPYNVTILSEGDHTTSSNKAYAYLTIDGTKYNTSTVLECSKGTQITCTVKNSVKSSHHTCAVYVNGERVAYKTSSTAATSYRYTLESDVYISLTAEYVFYVDEQLGGYCGRIYITTL